MSQIHEFRLFLILVLLLRAMLSEAHMAMSEPPPINYKTNPYSTQQDFDYTSPLSPSGSNYPCRGQLKHLSGPAGQSVRNYSPGGTYDLKIDGSAVHGGGSCQASLSYDGGSSWTVIKSWVGDCPHATGGGQGFKFTIPKDAPTGNAVFAWTWFNKIGNREMYMNCASVTIGGGKKRRATSKKRNLGGPSIFIANLGNGCSTQEGSDLMFPDAGSEVEYGGDGKRAPPAGSCGEQVFTGGGATGGSGSGSGTGGGNGQGGESTNPGGGGTPGGGAAGGGGGGGGGGTGAGAGAGAGGGAGTGAGAGGGAGTGAGAGAGTGAGVGTGAGAGTGAGGYNGGQYTPIAGPGYGGGSTATTGYAPGATATDTTGPTVADGEGGQGCDYWRSQGYICSAGERTAAIKSLIFTAAPTLLAAVFYVL